jgi:hypothetical protein
VVSNPARGMDVCICFSVFSYVGTGLCDGLITRPKESWQQGRIKGFVGPRHFSSLRPFGDSKKYYWKYSVLSIIRANGGGRDARIIEKHG